MTGARFEIDGTPRDRKDYAMEAARVIKSKTPHSRVEVKDLQSGEALPRWLLGQDDRDGGLEEIVDWASYRVARLAQVQKSGCARRLGGSPKSIGVGGYRKVPSQACVCNCRLYECFTHSVGVLLNIAATWESLANDRIKTAEGLERIAKLEKTARKSRKPS